MAPLWRNKSVVVYTDNMTARAAINKGRSQDKEVLWHIRNLYWMAHFCNFSIRCEHIKGSRNVHADAVSRLSEKGPLMFWLSLLSNGSPYTVFDIYMWLCNHMSLISCASILSHVYRLIPWLKRWTLRWWSTGLPQLQHAQNGR